MKLREGTVETGRSYQEASQPGAELRSAEPWGSLHSRSGKINLGLVVAWV